MQVVHCGRVDYALALTRQERLAADIAAGRAAETLLLLEHPPVYTIGRGGDAAHLLDPQAQVLRVDRGGDITWHGPGQVVGYPLVHLGRRGRDLHHWLCLLEELLIRTLAAFAVPAGRRAGMTGVWSERGKIGFVGVGVRRWVSLHGFSLNVCPDLTAFDRIVPCGIPSCPLTSMAREIKPSPAPAAVATVIGQLFPALLDEWLPLVDTPSAP
ncbi:MAG: lipoyl(octanoyl) transferase LipB [Desulfobulbaceae bacterium]|nr:lipoyl(octanoyl) transferase LipB [Desulfobulbaceae bacterium]